MSPRAIKKKRKRAIHIQDYFQWVFPMLLSIIAAIFLVHIVGSVIIVKGDSMSPTYKAGDFVFVNKLSYQFKNPQRYDVVAFEGNADDTESSDEKPYYILSRIVGMPGETVQIIDGSLYINEEKIESEYIEEKILNPGVAQWPVTLASNQYFVLGDNCAYSEDSRFSNIGTIQKDMMLGKVMSK